MTRKCEVIKNRMVSVETVFKKSKFSWEDYFSDKKKGGTGFQLKNSLLKRRKRSYSILTEEKRFWTSGAGQGNSSYITPHTMKKS